MKLTKVRLAGLELLATHESMRESNVTDPERGYLYWQTAQWLERQALAVRRNVLGVMRVSISGHGRKVLAATAPTASTIGAGMSRLRGLELADGWAASDDFVRAIGRA